MNEQSLNLWQELLLKALSHLHMIIVLFFSFAALLPWEAAWAVHLIVAPIMVLQWRINRDMCIISNIENLIRGESFYPEATDEQEGQFLKSLYRKAFKKEPSDNLMFQLTYGILGLNWLVCLWRFVSA